MTAVSTTLDYRLRPTWRAATVPLGAGRPGTLARLGRVLRAARRSDVLVLDGTSTADKLATALLARVPHGPDVLVLDCSWKLGPGRLQALLTRAGVQAMAGPRTTFVALTAEGAGQFARVHRVAADRVAHVPWHHGLDEEALAAVVTADGPIFSGGRTARDYRALLRCAATLDRPVVIATVPGGIPADEPVPPSVTVRTEQDPEAFRRDLRAAEVVVVALERRDDCAPGIMVLLDALALGKLTVVTDTLGVREHVEQGVTGFVVPAEDADALGQTLRWCLDPANTAAVAAIRERAREVARAAYGPERHVAELLALVDRTGRRRRAQGRVPKTQS
ncbi:glycosyltransferase [Arsenicicoccus sp. oral taxon 190]|uniref:glycosyltransferase n=1 Tax=Arsenicicoccus sp. oral taxon 190 TaxID=1658671 RepID=UPI00067A21CC|nr:glycosyltransferase [Arsenicicoccus sp. oral taxon 190]AKT50125.1 hypothetical protein ADJ73_00095 [Arsenicicoccus sp. oral taxon 190]